jgi:hypothetical protein
VRRSLVLVIALAACGGASKPAAAPPAATAAPEAPAAAPKDGVPVVVDAGAEPRYALRYHPSAGAQQTMTFRMDMGMTIDGVEVPIPTMTMDAVQQVLAVADDGTVSMRMSFTRASAEPTPDLTPEQHAQVQGMLRRYENVGMSSKMSVHGQVYDVEVDPGTPPDIAKSFEQIQMAFQALPAEPIGRGARWKTHGTKPIEGNAGTIGFDGTYEALEVDAEHIRIRAEVVLSSDASSAAHVTGNAHGESVVDLRTFRSEGSVVMYIESSADGHTLGIETDMTFEAR